jgi:chitodextrinase
MGFRNPFRITLKPNTGEHLPSMGNPGTIYVGDVGSYHREELNVVTAGGQNFGWPRFEGIVEQTNPMVQFPYGRDVEFSQDFVHKRAAFDYRGANATALAYVDSTIREIGTNAPDAIPGISIVGNSSTGGIFYQGDNFPASYKGNYFHGDFAANWLHSFTMNNNDELSKMESFQPYAPAVTCVTENPINGYLYYVSYTGDIREIKYDAGNQPPKAVANQSTKYGVKPLNVLFDGSLSSDPENGTITYSWDFGDGSPTSSIVNPSHSFSPATDDPTSFNVTLTVTDDTGQTNTTTLLVSVNNTPPKIDSTNVDKFYTFNNTTPFTLYLQPYVTDTETATNLLQYKWEPILHHDNHTHPESSIFTRFGSTNISPLPCDGHSYYYEIKLTVTDLQGLSSTVSHNIYPACSGIDMEVPSTPINIVASQITTNTLLLDWSSSTDNFTIAYYEIYQNGIKIGTSQSTSFSVKGLQSGTTYAYTIKAKDASENVSLASDPLTVTTVTAVTIATTQDETIYGDALNTNWLNFSSIAALDMANASLPFINTKSIKITNPTSGETLDFRKSSSLSVADFPHGIEFWVYNDGNTAYPIQVQTFETSSGGGSPIISVMADPKKWIHYILEWTLFGNPSQVGKVVMKLNQTQSESLYFDEVKLLYCADMQSVKTGNWDDTSVWSCKRLPITTDIITINAGHIVTIPTGVSATLNILQLLGTLNKELGSTLNINNY